MHGQEIRRIVLEQSKRADVGHIGSALSIADIVAALYADVLRIARPGRSGPRPLRALEGPRGARALRGALPARLADA